MKQLYFSLFITCAFVFKTQAQNIEYLWQDDFFSTAQQVTYSTTDSSWVVAGNQTYIMNPPWDWRGSLHYLTKFSIVGVPIWNIPSISPAEVALTKGLDLLNNGDIILLPDSDGCDFGVKDTLMRFSSAGVSVNNSSNQSINYFSSLFALSNDNIIASHHDSIKLFDSNFTLLWTASLQDFNLRVTFREAPNGDIFVFGDDEISKINPLTGGVINTMTGTDYVAAAQFGEFFYVIDKNKTVALLDTSFNFGFATFDISSHFDEVFKAEATSMNDIYILGKKNGLSVLKKFNSAFVEQASTTINTAQNFIRDFAIGNNQIAIVGSNFSHTIPSGISLDMPIKSINLGSAASFFKILDLNLNHSIGDNIDAGVVNVQFNDIQEIDSMMCSPFSVQKEYKVNDIAVTVQNFGSKAIQKLSIFTRYENNCMHFCPAPIVFNWDFDNLNLAPGDTTTFFLNDISIKNQTAGNPLNLCFWTGNVDNKIDNNQSNDKNCLTVQTVSSKEIINYQTIQLFPNPTSNHLSLTLPVQNQNANIEILNTVGQLIFSKNVQIESENVSLDVNRIPQGFYVIKCITNNKEHFIGKFIKNN